MILAEVYEFSEACYGFSPKVVTNAAVGNERLNYATVKT